MRNTNFREKNKISWKLIKIKLRKKCARFMDTISVIRDPFNIEKSRWAKFIIKWVYNCKGS
jgi:hypothetical protein